MPFSTDTFTDTAGVALISHTGELGATWTQQSVSGGDPTPVISNANRVRPTGFGGLYSLYRTSGTPATAEYDISCDVYYAGSGFTSKMGPSGRISTSASTGYLSLLSSLGTLELWKVVAGSFTQLATTPFTLNAGNTYRILLEIRNNSQKVYAGGTLLLTATDSAITATGKAGLWVEGDSSNTAGMHVDNFDASDVDVTAPTLSALAIPSAGTSLTATLSESGCLPTSGTGGFTLAGTSATVASWAISGTTLTLTLTGTVYSSETVTLSYARSATTDDIHDAAGNFLADFSGASVSNGSTQSPAVVAGFFLDSAGAAGFFLDGT